MPSLRELMSQASGAAEPQQPDTLHMDLADRLRKTTQTQVELARQEVQARQDAITDLEERLAELSRQDLPANEVRADLNEAMNRLGDARAKLTRAEEAQFNAEIAANKKAPGPSLAEAAPAKPTIRDRLMGVFNRQGSGAAQQKEAQPAPAVKFKR